MGFDIFKLEKLKISAFDNVEREGHAKLSFVAMFNPASYSQTFGIAWGEQQGINASGAELKYTRSLPDQLSLDLVLDGTGVDEIGVEALSAKSVEDRIKEFLDVTYRYDGTIHQAPYLLVEWGGLAFPCRLSSATINYTRFNRDGKPLRAELKVGLIADYSDKRRAKVEQKSSPDLTHARIVRAGDTLPLLTKAIYGSSARYLDVARYNRLDDFRSLVPGRELLFPPIVELDDAGPEKGG